MLFLCEKSDKLGIMGPFSRVRVFGRVRVSIKVRICCGVLWADISCQSDRPMHQFVAPIDTAATLLAVAPAAVLKSLAF